MALISKDIEKAASLLQQGKLVAIPTETVYGLAADIYNEHAVQQIFAVKQRPHFNPLIVHIPNRDYLPKVALEIPEKAWALAEAFWPGSLTLILKKQPRIPLAITAGKDTVAVRMPQHPMAIALLEKLPFPLAAPSANPFNRISPTTAQHVANYFGDEIGMVLDGGTCNKGIESTIVGFNGDEVLLYRFGSLAREDIEKVVGPIKVQNKSHASPTAPGMLAKHYSPKTKSYLVDDVLSFLGDHPNKRVGVLSFKTKYQGPNLAHLIVLSKEGNLEEAAAGLYGALHELDDQELDLIVAERMPSEGLGASINDRLERATQ